MRCRPRTPKVCCRGWLRHPSRRGVHPPVRDVDGSAASSTGSPSTAARACPRRQRLRQPGGLPATRAARLPRAPDHCRTGQPDRRRGGRQDGRRRFGTSEGLHSARELRTSSRLECCQRQLRPSGLGRHASRQVVGGAWEVLRPRPPRTVGCPPDRARRHRALPGPPMIRG
jgi:hypothetical protein